MKSPRLALALVLAVVPAGHATVDTDTNGLSDLYEFLYFGGPSDPAGDPDGDGRSTLEEMVWGTDPTRANSVPQGASAQIAGDELLLTWPMAEGKWYRLQTTTDLVAWETAAEGRVGSHQQPLDQDGHGPTIRFWRVQAFLLSPDSDGDGIDDWEAAIWKAKYGQEPGRTDLDRDGLPDSQEFLTRHQPLRQDHPAVGLVVFTPLEP